MVGGCGKVKLNESALLKFSIFINIRIFNMQKKLLPKDVVFINDQSELGSNVLTSPLGHSCYMNPDMKIKCYNLENVVFSFIHHILIEKISIMFDFRWRY